MLSLIDTPLKNFDGAIEPTYGQPCAVGYRFIIPFQLFLILGLIIRLSEALLMKIYNKLIPDGENL